MSRPRRVSATVLAAAFAGGVGLTACSADPEPAPAPPPATTTPSSEQKRTVLVNATEPRRAMLPADIADEYGARIGALIYRGLSRYDAKGRLVNEVAEEIAQEAPLRYRIKVRKGWVFGNGEPVTAASFVNAWTYAANPAHGQLRTDAFATIAGFRAMRGEPEPPPPPTTPETGTTQPSAASPTVTTTPAATTTPTAAATPTPGSARRATTLSGLRLVSDLEFTVVLAAPDPAFPDRLAQ